MSYETRDTFNNYKHNNPQGPSPELMGASTLTGDDVHNLQGEHLGDIKEFMLDMQTGKVSYAVMSVGGIFSIGEKLFAIPFSALTLDTENKRFVLDVRKERLETAPGFDANDWPDMADPSWSEKIHSYYGTTIN